MGWDEASTSSHAQSWPLHPNLRLRLFSPEAVFTFATATLYMLLYQQSPNNKKINYIQHVIRSGNPRKTLLNILRLNCLVSRMFFFFFKVFKCGILNNQTVFYVTFLGSISGSTKQFSFLRQRGSL